MLLILCKEARPLWKEVALTWALLLYLTYRDCWRDGYIPDAMEGWLHLLLPLAWSYLTARSLQQPSAGHPRTAQLGAKFLLIVICIHVPYFLSNATVLQARGFALLPFIPDLLQKQMLLFFCLTLPSMALASIVRNAMQFIVSAFALAGAAILVYGSGSWPVFAFQPIPWLAPDRVPQNIALLVLALTSASTVPLASRAPVRPSRRLTAEARHHRARLGTGRKLEAIPALPEKRCPHLYSS